MIISASKNTVTRKFLTKLPYIVFIEHFSLSIYYRYHNVNINVAVQTDNGLFVPVIRVSDWLCSMTLKYVGALFPIISLSRIHMV